MPRRPTKKTTEGSEGIADPLWGTEQQSDRVVEEEDRSPCKVLAILECHFCFGGGGGVGRDKGNQPQSLLIFRAS